MALNGLHIITLSPKFFEIVFKVPEKKQISIFFQTLMWAFVCDAQAVVSLESVLKHPTRLAMLSLLTVLAAVI